MNQCMINIYANIPVALKYKFNSHLITPPRGIRTNRPWAYSYMLHTSNVPQTVSSVGIIFI